jgi:hypothetical protein
LAATTLPSGWARTAAGGAAVVPGAKIEHDLTGDAEGLIDQQGVQQDSILEENGREATGADYSIR